MSTTGQCSYCLTKRFSRNVSSKKPGEIEKPNWMNVLIGTGRSSGLYPLRTDVPAATDYHISLLDHICVLVSYSPSNLRVGARPLAYPQHS